MRGAGNGGDGSRYLLMATWYGDSLGEVRPYQPDVNALLLTEHSGLGLAWVDQVVCGNLAFKALTMVELSRLNNSALYEAV